MESTPSGKGGIARTAGAVVLAAGLIAGGIWGGATPPRLRERAVRRDQAAPRQ